MSAAMNLLKACSVALISSALAIAVSAQDAKPTPPPTAPAPMALRLESGELAGPAPEPPPTAIPPSPFVAVGEDHGFNEIPQFMSAVWDAAHFNNLVIETG